VFYYSAAAGFFGSGNGLAANPVPDSDSNPSSLLFLKREDEMGVADSIHLSKDAPPGF
jgi:hypothetical protein